MGVEWRKTQSLQPMNSLPIGPRTSPPLTSLKLSQQTFRLKIITFPTESCVYIYELIISAGNNASRFPVVYKKEGAEEFSSLNTADTSVVISGLAPDTAYVAVVSAGNDVGVSEASPPVSFTTGPEETGRATQ